MTKEILKYIKKLIAYKLLHIHILAWNKLLYFLFCVTLYSLYWVGAAEEFALTGSIKEGINSEIKKKVSSNDLQTKLLDNLMPISHQISFMGTEHTAETKLGIQLRGSLVLQNDQPIKFKLKLKQLFDVCLVNCEIQMSLYPQAATSRVRDIIRHTEQGRTPLTLLHG